MPKEYIYRDFQKVQAFKKKSVKGPISKTCKEFLQLPSKNRRETVISPNSLQVNESVLYITVCQWNENLNCNAVR